LKQVDLGFYEHYVCGKEKRVKFLKVGEENNKGKLKLVHTNI